MRTTLNFVTPDAAGEVRFVLDNGWTGTDQRSVPIDLEDWRPIAADLSLDREGVVLDRVVSGVSDYRDPAQLAERWTPAARDTILRATGGTFAVTFAGPLVRFSEADAQSRSSAVSAPARAVHADLAASFTFDQFPAQPHAEAAVAELRERLGSREPARWRVFNLWQALSPPPQDVSLAFCALPSLDQDDYVAGHGHFAQAGASIAQVLADRTRPPAFDITFLSANPAQRWGHFADMLPGEAAIFSTFDPARAPGFARVPHGAVTVARPGRPAIPRSSIEIRALVIYED